MSTAYKLPVAPGSTACTEDLCQVPAGYISTSPAGQLHCSSIHYQSRGIVLPTLAALAKTMWLWALERDVMIVAQHILFVSNMLANNESRDRSDWMLACSVFLKINQVLRPLEVDL